MIVKYINKQDTNSFLKYIAIDDLFLSKNKEYVIYGQFEIDKRLYYLICDSMFSKDGFEGYLLYPIEWFSRPEGVSSRYCTTGIYNGTLSFDNICFPEAFDMPNYLELLYSKDQECLRIFNFYKSWIDSENFL